MPALPPDRPRGLPSAPGGPAAGEPGGTGTADAGCPHPPARPRSPAGPRPLPDPEAIRLCLISDSAPPYDAEVAAPGPAGAFPRLDTGPGSTGPGSTSSGSASLDSASLDSTDLGGAHGAARPSGPGSPRQKEAPGPARPRKLPAAPGASGRPGSPASPPGWPGQFAQVLAETLAGSRPPRQLVPWTTERARDRIQRLGPLLSAGQQPRVRRVVTFHPTADAMEMAVVVVFGQRVHALALRLERGGGQATAGRAPQPGRWLCVAVEAA
jgi:Family of unknown function (DUF6459)